MRKIIILLFGLITATVAFAQLPQSEEHALLLEQAEAGDPEAMNYLGYLLLSGADGMERDPEAGLAWLRKAAEAGHVKAISNLGWLLIEGEILEQDVSEGAQWIARAADEGLPVAQSLLGDLYLEGKGVEQSTMTADSLYREAFERGLPDAGYKLYALNKARYELLPPDEQTAEGKYYYIHGAPSEGVKLFYMAAEQQYPQAYTLLGDAYSRALGAPYDHDLSLRYFARGAAAGDPSAQYVLAELLEIFPDALSRIDIGTPISDDPEFWYREAQQGGVDNADDAYDILFDEK